MTEDKPVKEKPQRQRGLPVGGIILLFVGIVFLLQTLNILPWGLWSSLWRFWPVILILIALRIILRSINLWLMDLIVVVVLLGCLGLAIWQHGLSSSTSGQLSPTFTQPVGDLRSAAVDMDLAVSDISLSALAPGSTNLVEAGFSGNQRDAAIRSGFSQSGTVGSVSIKLERTGPSWSGSGFSWQAKFARDIPLTMDLKSAVSNLEADFSDLNLASLTLKVDVGNCKLTLPASVASGQVSIDTALSNTEIVVPPGVAARITVQTNLSAVDINRGRFPRQGDYFVSSDYANASKKLDINVHGDLGRIQVK